MLADMFFLLTVGQLLERLEKRKLGIVSIQMNSTNSGYKIDRYIGGFYWIVLSIKLCFFCIVCPVLYCEANGQKCASYVWWKGILVFLYAGPFYVTIAVGLRPRLEQLLHRINGYFVRQLIRLSIGFLWYLGFHILTQWTVGDALSRLLCFLGLNELFFNLSVFLLFETPWIVSIHESKQLIKVDIEQEPEKSYRKRFWKYAVVIFEVVVLLLMVRIIVMFIRMLIDPQKML